MYILSTLDTSKLMKCTRQSSETCTTARPTSGVCALGISTLKAVPSDQEGALKKRFATKIRVFVDRFSPKKCNRLPAEFVELEGASVAYRVGNNIIPGG